MGQIILKDVSVEHCIHNAASRSLQLKMFTAIGGRLAEHKKSVIVKALCSINLEINDGDRIGVIGRNGAGKTTLLRTISGVYQPTRGSIHIEGKISSFTDITLGMDMEATGLENIIFRLVFLGMTFKEAKNLSPSIEEFSELGNYLNMPVRTYSTGMFLRLAFAISTAIKPEIIVMDEMIGAGDVAFLEKAKQRIHELLDNASILVLSTHDSGILRSMCNKVVWLDHGEIKNFGPFDNVYPEYIGSKN